MYALGPVICTVTKRPTAPQGPAHEDGTVPLAGMPNVAHGCIGSKYGVGVLSTSVLVALTYTASGAARPVYPSERAKISMSVTMYWSPKSICNHGRKNSESALPPELTTLVVTHWHSVDHKSPRSWVLCSLVTAPSWTDRVAV